MHFLLAALLLSLAPLPVLAAATPTNYEHDARVLSTATALLSKAYLDAEATNAWLPCRVALGPDATELRLIANLYFRTTMLLNLASKEHPTTSELTAYDKRQMELL